MSQIFPTVSCGLSSAVKMGGTIFVPVPLPSSPSSLHLPPPIPLHPLPLPTPPSFSWFLDSAGQIFITVFPLLVLASDKHLRKHEWQLEIQLQYRNWLTQPSAEYTVHSCPRGYSSSRAKQVYTVQQAAPWVVFLFDPPYCQAVPWVPVSKKPTHPSE